MIIPLKQRLVKAIESVVDIPVVYGFQQSDPRGAYVRIGNAESQITADRIAPSRSANTERWSIELIVVSNYFATSSEDAEIECDAFVQTILNYLADHSTLDYVDADGNKVGSFPLDIIIPSAYTLTSGEDSVEGEDGIVAIANLILEVQLRVQ